MASFVDPVSIQPPNLPRAEATYTAYASEAHNNVLRLFFSRVADLLRGILGEDGGKYIQSPYANVSSVMSQPLVTTIASQRVTVEYIYGSQGLSIENNAVIRVSTAGVYQLQAFVTIKNAGGVPHTVDLWWAASVDNVDNAGLPGTRVRVTLQPGVQVVAVPCMSTLVEHFGVVLRWVADSTDVSIDYEGSVLGPPAKPAAFAVSIEVQYVSSWRP